MISLDELLAAAGIGRDDPNGYMPPDLDPMAYMPRPMMPTPQPVEAPPMQLPGAGGGGFAENFGLALAQSPLAYRSRGRGGAEDFIGNLLASAGNSYAGATARGVQQREGFNERQRIAMADRNRSNIAASRLAEREKIERLQKVSDSARTLRERRSEKEADRRARLEDETLLIGARGAEDRRTMAAKSRLEAGGKGAAPKPPTGFELKEAAYFKQAKDALDAVETPRDDLGGKSLEEVIVGRGDQFWRKLSPVFQGQLLQEYLQAQGQFSEAHLRSMSGATITPNEYAMHARTYFASPGERAISSKRRGRRVALEGLRTKAGRAVDPNSPGAAPTPEELIEQGWSDVGNR